MARWEGWHCLGVAQSTCALLTCSPSNILLPFRDTRCQKAKCTGAGKRHHYQLPSCFRDRKVESAILSKQHFPNHLCIKMEFHMLHSGMTVQQPGDQKMVPSTHEVFLLQKGGLISQKDLGTEKKEAPSLYRTLLKTIFRKWEDLRCIH